MIKKFDTIIIGGSSAGGVLVNRLSADPPHRVLLLEAGGKNTTALVSPPRGFGKLMLDPRHLWEFETPRGATNTATRRMVTGCGLGGSSSVNGMVWYKPQPEDFEDWAETGVTGWGRDETARSFQALENHEMGFGDARGVGGPVPVTLHPERQTLCEAFIAPERGRGFRGASNSTTAARSRWLYSAQHQRRPPQGGPGHASPARFRPGARGR